MADTVGVSRLKAFQSNASENILDSSLSTMRLTRDPATAIKSEQGAHQLRLPKDASGPSVRSERHGLLPEEWDWSSSPGSGESLV